MVDGQICVLVVQFYLGGGQGDGAGVSLGKAEYEESGVKYGNSKTTYIKVTH
jgi:hypothetical protein